MTELSTLIEQRADLFSQRQKLQTELDGLIMAAHTAVRNVDELIESIDQEIAKHKPEVVK